jgi:hypothetical protein
MRMLKHLISYIKNFKKMQNLNPVYKLVEIINEDDSYIVVIKVHNKNITFQSKPEEILANDKFVDQFSQRDIRALTYLGYLGINGPKYKILAQKCIIDDKILFVLKKKGDKKIIIKTADQILKEVDIISNMNANDAKVIGYTVASETIPNEKKQKSALHKK